MMIPLKVVLALGSNLGDRMNHLNHAVNFLSDTIDDILCSSVYETAPWGYEEQPYFLNMVVSGYYSDSAVSLLHFCQNTERAIGRTSSFLYGPREIDIDILLYGTNIIDEEGLTIPHPKMLERAFVLIPLAEILPEMVIPDTNITVTGLLQLIGSPAATVIKWGSLKGSN